MLTSRARTQFSCLTTGDTIRFSYAGKQYELSVLETKPARGISIVEADVEVDFAPPVGYVEPDYKANAAAAAGTSAGGARRTSNVDGDAETSSDEEEEKDDRRKAAEARFLAFNGGGQRLDGRPLKEKQVEKSAKETVLPAAGIKVHSVATMGGKKDKAKAKPVNPLEDETSSDEEGPSGGFKAFQGSGNRLV